MKFLENPKLAKLSEFLSENWKRDTELSCRIEHYSCKRAGADKKVSKILETKFRDTLSSSPANVASWDWTSKDTMKTFIDLILSLNALFPDYDFSGAKADDFNIEQDIGAVMSSVNTRLEFAGTSFLRELWPSIDDVIDLKNCQTYQYVPKEDDPFMDAIWSFHYFFVNKDLKSIVFFTCMAEHFNSTVQSLWEME
eukprot:TRINITY_DN776103_c0_g1_i1.p1 TRINITY_DN776103_c0_g1~~TRINITY_DN776103_c0_g1_i1.p1  ORF type:complete len:196 (+),score=12.49 TRINITY_DN776103_c0_g1_i1:77-664(+)